MAARAKTDPDSVTGRCMAAFTRDERAHRRFAGEADRFYRAYRGLIEKGSDADKWRNTQHPPYIFQVVETMVAGLLDPNPRWRLRTRTRMAGPQDIRLHRDGVKANQLLLDEQLANDFFLEKQRPFMLQALITRLTVGKTYWRFEEAPRKRIRPETQQVVSAEGWPVGYEQALVASSTVEVIHDDPTFEVVDVRDFIWHEAAVSLERAARVTHRVWQTFDELKLLEASGFYKNVDELKDTGSQTRGLQDRERDLFDVSRTKDMIEVLEHWYRDDDGALRVVTIGNRKVLLADRPSPFWHNQYPFVVCSGTPDLFRIPGVSEVELMVDLQEMLWTLGNQRLDNLMLLNNAVALMREDMDDPEAFNIYPGARNLVSDPSQVTIWTPPDISGMSLQHEALLKQDLQAIPGASPALLGQTDPNAGQQTATEVSTLTNLAMRRLAAKKHQAAMAYARVGEQWIELNQQFIRESRLVEIVGPDAEPAFKTISPEVLQGRYRIDVEQMDASMIRQERTAEAQARLQVALNAAQFFAAIPGQPGLNLKQFMDDYLDAADINDVDRYYSSTPQPQLPPGPQAPSRNGQPPAGVTAPQAADVNSPSHVLSQSPVMALQRQAAMAGGPANG